MKTRTKSLIIFDAVCCLAFYVTGFPQSTPPDSTGAASQSSNWFGLPIPIASALIGLITALAVLLLKYLLFDKITKIKTKIEVEDLIEKREEKIRRQKEQIGQSVSDEEKYLDYIQNQHRYTKILGTKAKIHSIKLQHIYIPLRAYEPDDKTRTWVIDQYRVKTDKRSGIVSDPNNPDDPEYIVRLVG
jgi:hypothetical protein